MGTNNYIARLKAQLDQAIIQREHWKKLAESRNLLRREKELAEQPSAIALSIEAAEEEHGSLRAAAKALDVDHGYLSRLKNGDKSNPSDELLAKLGLERLVIYRTAAHDKQSGGVE